MSSTRTGLRPVPLLLGVSVVLGAAAVASAQPASLPPGHQARWPAYREAVVLEVAGQVGDLADPNLPRASRDRLVDEAERLLAHYRYFWETAPRRAWRHLRTRAPLPVPGLALSAPALPPHALGHGASFREAVLAEEAAARAELEQPWMLDRRVQARPGLEARLRESRGAYQRAWSTGPSHGWSALDHTRIVRALSELRRERDHARRASTTPLRDVIVAPSASRQPLYVAPGNTADVYGHVEPGEVLTVHRAEHGWLLVGGSLDLFRGWIHRSKVQPVSPAPGTLPPWTPVTTPATPAPAPAPTNPTGVTLNPGGGISIHLRLGGGRP
jgi:hypothetical protein